MSNANRSGGLLNSFKCAFTGLFHVLATQRNMRIHIAAATVVVVLSSVVRLSGLEWVAITLTIAFVWFAEAVNTSIEAVVDLVSPEWNEKARVAKDVAAGAVLIAALGAVAVGLIILGPGLWALVRG